MKNKIVFIICLLLFVTNVRALTYGGCDYTIISDLKKFVNNINISYTYHMENGTPYFDVTLSNITNNMYFYDNVNRKNYYYSDTNNGTITIKNYVSSPSYTFYSSNNECSDIKLGKKYATFPIYNYYSTSDLCSGIENYSLCKRWANISYSYSEFESKVLEYKESLNTKEDINKQVEYEETFLDKLAEYYVNYYYYFLGSIILICGSIIIIKSRNNKFKL